MKYKLHFPFVGNVDMLREAVESARGAFADIHIWADGVPSPDIAGVTHHALPPNGAVATFNSAFQSSWDDDVAFLMHTDALVFGGGGERFIDFTRKKFESDEKWGVNFTLYDVLCSFNMKAIREVGFWDPRLYQYGSDNDYWYRLKLAGWSINESAPIPGLDTIPDKFTGTAHINESVGVIHRGSATIRLDPLFKYISDGRNPGNEDYYRLKWGGLPNHETFTRPFDGFYR